MIATVKWSAKKRYLNAQYAKTTSVGTHITNKKPLVGGGFEMSDWDGLVAERRYRMAVQPWTEVITELRVDRGMLIGSSQFTEMTGVERVTSLAVIDAAIKTANGWIEHYKTDRDRIQGGILNLFKTKKIQAMTDEELGEV